VERRTVALVFCAAFAVCALLTKPRAVSWNDLSRVATIDALVTRRTLAIDGSPFAARTKDKYRYRGRTYSDKPPALAIEGAAVASLLAPFGITLARTTDRAVYLITLLTVGGWFAAGCAYAYAFQRLLGFGRRGAVFVAALTGLGTLALPYATVLANHVPAGAAALAGLYHLARVREGSRAAAHAVLGALFLTLAYAFDASAVVFGLGALVLLWGTPARVWAVFAVACIPVLVLQLAYNASVSTGIVPPAMNQTTWSDPSSPFHRADQSEFLFTSAGDYARYAVYLLLGDKGLVSYTPLALLCAYGLVRMWNASARRLALAIAAPCAAYYALMVAFTNDYGALNYGERRYVDLAFVLCIALGPALAALPRGAAAVAARLAAAWSIAVAMLGALAPFGEPRGVSGIVFASQELGRLAHRAPVQAALDVLAFAVVIVLVQRFWWSPAVPTSGSARRAA
jgi:hypothetical protein